MENLKMVNWEIATEDELVNVMLQEQEEMMSNLNKALNYMKGKEVIVDTYGGLMVQECYDNFDFSCFPNVEGEMLLDFMDESEEVPTITIKLKDIESVEIDDNSEYLDGTTDEQYEVEDIIIMLENGIKLRLEKQW